MFNHPNLKIWLPLNGDCNDVYGSSPTPSSTVGYSTGVFGKGTLTPSNRTTDFITFANTDYVTGDKIVAVSIYAKLTTTTLEAMLFKIVTSTGCQFGISYTPDSLGNGIIYGMTLNGSSTWLQSISNAYDDKWHHILFQKNGTYGEIYIDGVLIATTNTLQILTGSITRMTIGDGFGWSYKGQLDNFMLFSDIMFSAADVKRLMNGYHPLYTPVYAQPTLAYETFLSDSPSSITSTFAMTCSGSDRLLVVSIPESRNTAVSGVTYNGISLTQAITYVYNTVRCSIYYLVAPTSGTYNVIVTYASALTSRHVDAACFNNISQTNTLGNTATQFGNTNGNVNITARRNSLIIGGIGADVNYWTPYAPSIKFGQQVTANRLSFYRIVPSSSVVNVSWWCDAPATNCATVLVEFKATNL